MIWQIFERNSFDSTKYFWGEFQLSKRIFSKKISILLSLDNVLDRVSLKVFCRIEFHSFFFVFLIFIKFKNWKSWFSKAQFLRLKKFKSSNPIMLKKITNQKFDSSKYFWVKFYSIYSSVQNQCNKIFKNCCSRNVKYWILVRKCLTRRPVFDQEMSNQIFVVKIIWQPMSSIIYLIRS